jgi:hypothetical protein
MLNTNVQTRVKQTFKHHRQDMRNCDSRIGGLRFLSALESLTALVLITWTASFLYLEMTRYWDGK